MALTENCTATDATLLGVGEHGSTLVPPSGWKFAKQSDCSLAVSPEGKSVLAVREVPNGDESSVLGALEKLAADSGIEKVKVEALKKRFKKPQFTVDANGVKVDFWEIGKGTGNGINPELRGQGAGTLLVFVAREGTERVLTGVGFVVIPEAQADAEKIMQAVQSLKGTP